MKCSCCARPKNLFESYENVVGKYILCPECSRLLYKLRDAKNEGNKAAIFALRENINKRINKAEPSFAEWYKSVFDKEKA